MQTRRDDRFASIGFGPEPYFEIFCDEDETLKIGGFSEDFEYIVVIRCLISEKAKDNYLEIRNKRIEELKEQIQWLSVFHNTYNMNEFVAFMGFLNRDDYNKIKRPNDLFLEEYLFTGLRNPLGMSYIANYNQFICKSIKF